MGLFGFPFSVPFGGHQEMIATLKVTDIGSGVVVNFTPQNYAVQYYRLMVDDRPCGTPIYANTSAPTTLRGLYSASGTKHVWSLCPQGDGASAQIDISAQQGFWQAGRNDRLHIDVVTSPRIFSYGDSGQLSSWAVTGFRRFVNCRPVLRRPTWGSLTVQLSNLAGVRTVSLVLDGITLATGSRSGDGVLTLVQVAGSGISGTVTVTYTVDSLTGTLILAFPSSLKGHYSTSALSFPRTAEKTVNDDGQSNTFSLISDVLTSGVYNTLVHQQDELGNESAGATTQAVTVVSIPPAPASTPVYFSGGFAATVIHFSASTDAAATYNIYDSGSSGILDVETVTATHIAGTGTLSQTLAAIGAGFTGIRQVLIRSLKAGVESGNTDILLIEYTAGVVIKPRPPIPGLGSIFTTTGLLLTVPVVIDVSNQATAATDIRLYVYLENGGTPSYGAPQATTVVSPAVTGFINKNISYTVGAPGVYKFEVRTYSSLNSVESANTNTFGPVNLTTVVPADPTFTVFAGL